MKKRIAVILMCLISLTCLLTGCQLVTMDEEKYLNQTVAKVGDDIEITLEDLYMAYQNYASTLTSDSYGLNNKEALEYSLNYLIQKEILLIKAKNDVTLTQRDLNKVLNETYDFVISEIEVYEDEIRTERNEYSPIEPEEESETTESTEVDYVEHRYEPKVNFVNNEIVRNNTSSTQDEAKAYGYEVGYVKGFKAYWNKSDDEISTLAYSRFIDTLKEYEKGKNLSRKSDEVLLRELERVYELKLNDKYIEKLEEKYEDENLATVEEVYAAYTRLVAENKARYDLDEIGMDTYITDVLDNAQDVFYHPVENQFFYVSHILMQFNDEQTAKIDKQKKLLEQGAITQADFDAFKEELAKQISVTRRDENGNEIGGKILASEVYEELADALAGKTFEEKAKIFNSYLYQFNSDPGILNKEFDYVIGVENEEDKENEDGSDSRSRMVKEFTADSRELFKRYLQTGELGQLSAELVLTDYGYHIIFLTGVCENMVVSTNVIEAMNDLNSSKVSAHSEQTYFHNVYDRALTSKYNDYTLGYIENYKAGKECVTYTKVYNLLADRLG